MNKPRGRRTSPSIPPHDDIWRDASWRRRIRDRLLAWYTRNARDLPWRRQPTPYRVWVSEIMLQQTQVATVIPYFHRFLKSFPSVEALAAADEKHLLNHWEGLGYYRRARSMHAAAKQIVDHHHGQFPEQFADVIALPGIGRYTAGAILSISRDARLPILEGNTNRVFSRWVALRATATDPAAGKLLWEIAEAMLPRKHPGSFNQAAMELGALVCAPKKPDCQHCPVARMCRARKAGLEEQIPGKVSRVTYQDRTEFAMIVADPNNAGCQPTGREKVNQPRYLLRPLPDGRRWAGLWDFPRTTEDSLETPTAAAEKLSQEIGVKISSGMRLATWKHAVTKYRISLHVHVAEVREPRRSPTQPWRYVSLAEMSELPMSVTGRRIAQLLSKDRQIRLPLSER